MDCVVSVGLTSMSRAGTMDYHISRTDSRTVVDCRAPVVLVHGH